MLDSASKLQMGYICLQYPGYFLLAKWMERLAQRLADGVIEVPKGHSENFGGSGVEREQLEGVLKRFEQAMLRGHRIVVLAITWAEISQAGRGVCPTKQILVEAFFARLDAILP